MSMMLAPASRAVFQYFRVVSGSPAKKAKSIPANESASIFWMKLTSSPAVVTCPAASSASRSATSQSANCDSDRASLSSLPASEDAPTMAIRIGLPAITNSLASDASDFPAGPATPIGALHPLRPQLRQRQFRRLGAAPPSAP